MTKNSQQINVNITSNKRITNISSTKFFGLIIDEALSWKITLIN